MFATAGDVKTYYELSGAGRPLVLLHGGLLTNALCWDALTPRLAGSRQVVAIELQGHGHTADTEREMTLEHLADDVVTVLDDAGLAEADVFGFSLGGMVAVQTALRHPGRVGRLVLASVPVRPDGYVDLGEHPELLPTADDFAAMKSAYTDVAPDPGHFDAFAAKAEAMVGAFAGWTDEELASITAPVLVVVGDTDFVSLEHAVLMTRLLPDAGLCVLPRTTHMGVPRDADLLLPAVERFLSRP